MITRANWMIAIAIILALSIVKAPAIAKECKCDKHNAKASGSGSCSLSEDTSYCSITYSGSEKKSQGLTVTELVGKFGITIKPEDALVALDKDRPTDINPNNLRQIIAAALLSTLPGELSPPLRSELPSMVEKILNLDTKGFQKTGCLNLSAGDFRFFLISKYSEQTGCSSN